MPVSLIVGQYRLLESESRRNETDSAAVTGVIHDRPAKAVRVPKDA
jgi:hypothetical protein